MRDHTRIDLTSGHRRRRPPPPPSQPSNHHYQSPNLYYHYHHSDPHYQTPYWNPNYAPPQPQQGFMERIDRAVNKAREEILEAGGHVSAWEVSQGALVRMKVESWEDLGVQMQEVPSLRHLMATEGKINAFINCFVAVRRITTLHDLDVAICKNEGIERYEELELGPLVRHPLVMHYFSLSSDVKDIANITSEEIISYLSEFLNIHKGSRIEIDEFLDFATKKKSVSGREKISVRIQSLGTHISFIRQAKRFENDTLKTYLETAKENSKKGSSKQPILSSQKGQLDENFSSSVAKGFGSIGKHTTFLSSDEEFVSPGNIFSHNGGSFDQPRRCPYPSEAEERSGLGLKKADVDFNPFQANEYLGKSSQLTSKRKRQPERGSSKTITRAERRKMRRLSEKEFLEKNEDVFTLDFNFVRNFIMQWKETCRKNSVSEVFRRMLKFYKIVLRKKNTRLFASDPIVELINVAVISIARGMWDGMHDDFQDYDHQSVADKEPRKRAKCESIEIDLAEKNAVGPENCHIKHVTVDEIVLKISTFVELDHKKLSNVELGLKSKISFLRKLCKCEFWLAGQFSVEKFKSLGYGKFFMFLEKHVPPLYSTLQKCLASEAFDKPSLEVCMLEHQLYAILSQAANNCREAESITMDMIPPLLISQFPLVTFVLAERNVHDNFMDDVKRKGNLVTSVLFSASLLARHRKNTLSEKNPSGAGVDGADISCENRRSGSITTKDAVTALLRAPMLSDLITWTHWDIIFAPSFGPLVRWLLNEANVKELKCLVTKEGKVIKINHTASPDSFLEACLQGSSFQTSVELLSILSIYGGEAHIPLSLLKCHARQGFEVILKKSMEIENDEYTASRFFIDCLGHLPGEFRAFVAEILLSGLQFVLKDAPVIILRECKQIDQRHLLHGVGLSLGIVEWIDDYHSFDSSMADDSLIPSGTSCLEIVKSDSGRGSINFKEGLYKPPSADCKISVSAEFNPEKEESDNQECKRAYNSLNKVAYRAQVNACDKENEALRVVESIRRGEFGLDSELSDVEASMLKKQHARLGRALHCLSQELYSQDSHFLLELIQNADDNSYPENAEPTLTFILHESGIVVLNNELGFSSQNIRALCDVGSSTKKGSTGGYIGKKGIGFKSVFRVTDAPEIHSNGFHVKFDITEGQIGFVLPTVVPACDVDFYWRLASCETNRTEPTFWNTCIVLPFRTKLSEESSSMSSIQSMFSDLHPSLLLFLHRLQCIRFRSILDDTMVIMRKELLGDNIVNISFGEEKMTWFVASQVLQADIIRPDVRTTEISIAFTLQDSGDGEYVPLLEQQPVFAFLPLRRYGLKFIIQADFVLPSSREEVDGDSPWNQWLLAKFPDLFASAGRSFCSLPCFRNNPGKAVSFFMSFVPLVGEVQGFFSSLPRLILSKLCRSKCLLMEGDSENWVLPCKVIRNWNDEALSLFSGGCLSEHFGFGFLDRNINLTDSLARALGIQEYGPKILVQVVTSLCQSEKAIGSAWLVWLSSCLNAIYTMLFNSSGQLLLSSGAALDVIDNLKKVPFIPLSGGGYSSIDDGTIWLHSDSSSPEVHNEHHLYAFSALYAKLRTVSPTLFSAAATVDICGSGLPIVDNVSRMLLRIGVQKLSAHEIVKVHILPAISDDSTGFSDKKMMLEYLSFVMCHLQTSCPDCHIERGDIISDLRERAFISTNNGFKKPAKEAIHFSQEFGNSINLNKLISGMDLKWHEVDVDFLQHPNDGPSSVRQWREFFLQIGVIDFVQVVSVEKNIADICNAELKNILWDAEQLPKGAVAKDWESKELAQLLSQLSLSRDPIRSRYLLEALDTYWEDCYSDKVACSWVPHSAGNSEVFKSSFINCLCGIEWVASSLDDKLHFAKDLFYDCEAVRSVLGANAPFAVPKLKSEKLLMDIGLKTQVSLDDVLSVIQDWRRSETPLMTSIAQMCKFYTFVWNEMATSKQKIIDELQKGPFIFCPYSWGSRHDDVVPGALLSPSDVHWLDFTGSMNQIKEINHHGDSMAIDRPLCKTLCNVYPSLHGFFANECGVSKFPHHRSYLQTLLDLSAVALPSQAAKTVFQVFLQWSDVLKSGLLNSDDVMYLKECLQKLEFAVLPTSQEKWVSLHPSFGLVCWSDDNNLQKEFEGLGDIKFLYFGELSPDEQELLRSKVSVIMQTLGILSISEVITHEAIYYGLADCSFKTSLLNWAFPYAQRYIYSAFRDRYLELEQSRFEFLGQVRIIVVDKLFSRNVIKGSTIASRKRCECKCLLQGNILYATQDSDSHSLFMELSQLLLGVSDIQLANFLHMITTMAESGSTEDQTEFFILNSQKIPKLPDSEPIWSLPSSSLMENDETLGSNSKSNDLKDQTPMNLKRKSGISSSWPPADWKTAPGSNFHHFSGMKRKTAKLAEVNTSCINISTEEGHPNSVTAMVVLPDSQPLEDQTNLVDSIDLDIASADRNLSHNTSNPEASRTGRLGERVAYNYFSANAGKNTVTWVNEDTELGRPYDLVIEDGGNSREYVEVKATKSSDKDWFHITLKEWEYAMNQGENFTIAHVILSDRDMAKITVFKNPVKLCQLGKLHLAVLMP